MDAKARLCALQLYGSLRHQLSQARGSQRISCSRDLAKMLERKGSFVPWACAAAGCEKLPPHLYQNIAPCFQLFKRGVSTTLQITCRDVKATLEGMSA